MEIVFVILHYKVESITSLCLETLLKQKYEHYHIILVDNHSANGSYEKIMSKYNHEKIYFTSLDYNLGFSKANDFGYQIAKHKYNADIIVVMNNDVLIEDSQFCQKLSEVYLKNNFDIMGPDILNKYGEHQNPLKGCLINEKQVKKFITRSQIKLFILKYFRVRIKNLSNEPTMKKEENLNIQYDVPLHGSCLIFGKNYIKNVEYPFYPETFLYAEEDILYYISQINHYKIIFFPSIKVLHYEDISTDSIYNDFRKKRIFELKNSIDSLKVFLKLIKQMRDQK